MSRFIVVSAVLICLIASTCFAASERPPEPRRSPVDTRRSVNRQQLLRRVHDVGKALRDAGVTDNNVWLHLKLLESDIRGLPAAPGTANPRLRFPVDVEKAMMMSVPVDVSGRPIRMRPLPPTRAR